MTFIWTVEPTAVARLPGQRKWRWPILFAPTWGAFERSP
jgi:hypothetical protein